MIPQQKRRTTAAAINASVKLRFAAHYCCTSGGCGNTLFAIFAKKMYTPLNNFQVEYFKK